VLVLTRQVEEEIIIGSNIRLRVLGVSGNQVRLGIEAPPEVTIFRAELYDEVARQNQAAAEGALEVLQALTARAPLQPTDQ
jgi:carbon storage regulator